MISLRKLFKTLCALAMILVFIIPGSVSRAEVEYEYPMNMTASADGRDGVTVRAIYYYYPGNIYVSLRDIATAFSGTSKNFDAGVRDKEITIKTGKDYIAVGGENVPFTEELNEKDFSFKQNLSRNKLVIDDIERKYYSIIISNSAGYQDAFFSITDIAMMFDVDIEIDGDNINISTDKSLEIDPDKLENDGFFTMINSAITGDVTTGEIFYSYRGDMEVAMASTTKLMTYAVVMDAVRNGQISESDIITVSSSVEKLASTSDGVIKLKEGDTYTVYDGLIGMLLPSSNEMALSLAEKVSGSEEEFVKLMNNKAVNLGMSDNVRFYNCNGLPSFSGKTINTKRQNMITARDMFILVEYIMDTYPEITDITSLKNYRIDSLQLTINNTNPLLYNMDGVVGLKTGTTTRAGYCLVTLREVTKDDGVHRLMAAEFGAESSYVRGMVSEILLRYSGKKVMENMAVIKDKGEKDISSPEKLIQFLLN